MAKVNEYQGLAFSGFPDGLNLEVDSSRLKPTEMSQALNVRIDPRGEVHVRSGYTRRDINITDPVKAIHGWVAPSGQGYIIAVDAAYNLWYDFWENVQYEYGTVMNPGSTYSTWGVGFASTDDKLYISSKITGTKRWEAQGASFPDVPSIPGSKHLIYHHDRLWAINSSANPSRIHYSELADPENMPAGNTIDVNPGDSFEVTAAVVFGDDIILFKDHSIWKLSGRTPDSFSLYRIDAQRGTIAKNSVIQFQGQLTFYDRSTGWWSFDGANLTLLSSAVNRYLLDNLFYEQAFRAAAYVTADRLYLSLPWGDGPYPLVERRTFVMFGANGGITEYTDGFGAATKFMQTRFLGLQTDGIFVANPDSNVHPPDPNPIKGLWRTGWTRISGPGGKARVRRIEMTVKSNTGSSCIVRMYHNYDDETPYRERTFAGGPDQWAVEADERMVALDGWGNRINSFMFEFESDDNPFQINDFTVFVSGAMAVRGET